MAEGFLHQANTNKSIERVANEGFDELFSRSFFQHSPDDKSLFIMHDLMNDLATSVAGDFFSRLDIQMKEFRKGALEKFQHMSFVRQRFMVYKRFEPFKESKSLRTFLAVSVGVIKSWDSNKVLNDFLPELPLLRVLSLSHLWITEIPEFVGSLKHLRYLNLSHTKITHLLENVCNLCNLQTLVIFGCDKLIKLPESFLNLKNLQHFDIRDTPLLKKMPLGIGELKSLRTLSKIIIGDESGFAITELKNLKELHGQISIWGLGNVENASHARESNLSQNKLSGLELDWGVVFNLSQIETHDKEVLNKFKPHSGMLEKLSLLSYRGIEFPNWVGDPLFHRLTHVRIHGCEECTSLPRLGELPSLKELFIGKMSKVKVVGLELLRTGVAFPSLEILSFGSMSRWEIWSTKSGVADAVFSRLQELRIEDCPSLVKISLEALPSLRVLKIRACGHGVLTSLVDVASLVTKLEINDISGLMDEHWRSVIECLGAIEEVNIEGCHEIRYLWESEAEESKVLMNLRGLNVKRCSKLVTLGEKEGEDNYGSYLTSLRSLYLSSCDSLKHCSCPDSIEFFEINHSDSVTCVSFPTGGQKLKFLFIENCKKLLEKELGEEHKIGVLINSNMQMLETVYINWCPHLK